MGIRTGSAARWAQLAAVIGFTASCGGQSPVQPTPVPTVTSISPSSGPSIGGTAITVTGSNFVAGASLTIGGVPAFNVTVIDSTMIAGTTPPAKNGAADVVVVSDGRTLVLPGGFTYMQVENGPPVISSMSAHGTRPNEPANFADLNEEIDVVSTVSDDETPRDQLTYEWTADVGSFIGTGRAVKWRAPAGLLRPPVDYPLTLTVTEEYQTTDETGAVVTAENTVTGTVTVHVHDSRKEVSDLAGEFLIDFSHSEVSPESAVRNFSDNQACGKNQELNDIRDNRANYIINSYSLSSFADVKVDFDGFCPLFGGRPDQPGDACVQLSCGWKSTIKASGTIESVDGTCYLTEIYEEQPDRWKLCWSDFRGTSTLTGKPVTGFSFRY